MFYEKPDPNYIPGNIYMEHNRRTGSMSMPTSHYHDAFEIYYLLEGQRYYFIKDRTYPVDKGNIVFININDLHKTLDAGVPAHERILVNFKKAYLEHIFEDTRDIDLLACFSLPSNVMKLDIYEQGYIQELLIRMMTEYRKQEPGSQTALKLLLAELLLFTSRRIDALKNENYQYPSDRHKKISEIVQYINENYSSHLTLESVSEQFYISKFYFSRSFKEVTGFTFVEYLNTLRVKEAKKMLLDTSLKIGEIAEKAGYESITHFGRIFKSITGISPLHYRKNLGR